MKTMKIIPFDIALREQIQSEENHYQGRYKVQTRNGDNVRILCWDKKEFMYPIVALVEIYDSYEASLLFCNNGKYYTGGDESSYDLCLVDTWKPKFKVGDRVRYKNGDGVVYTIVNILENHYRGFQSDEFIPFEDDDLLESAPEKPKLTKFENELANYLYKSIGVGCMDGIDFLAKELAPKLLEIAKKEIIEKLNINNHDNRGSKTNITR